MNGIINIAKVEKDLKRAIHAFCGDRCVYCGSSANYWLDHLIPYHICKHNLPENLLSACQSCNARKSTLERATFKEASIFIYNMAMIRKHIFYPRFDFDKLPDLPIELSAHAQLAIVLNKPIPDYSLLLPVERTQRAVYCPKRFRLAMLERIKPAQINLSY